MKRKFLLRMLSLLIAGTLVLETPAQVFAAQAAGVETPAAAEEQESADVLTEDVQEPDTEAADDSEAPAETAEPDDITTPEDPEGSEDTTTPEDPTEPGEVATPEDPEEPGDTATPEDPTEPGEAATPEDPTLPGEIQNPLDGVIIEEEQTEEPEEALAAAEEDYLVFSAERYGTTPSVVFTDDQAQKYSKVLELLDSAMRQEGGPTADLREVDETINTTLVVNLVNYLLKKNPGSYSNLSPQASWGKDVNDYVQYVTFLFTNTSLTLSVDSRTENSTALRVSGLVSGATSYELYRRDEAQTDVQKLDSRYVTQSGYVFTDLKAEIHDYTYILYAKDSSGKILAYSNLATSQYMPTAPTGVSVALSSPKSATVKWNASSTASQYYTYRIYRDGKAVWDLAGNATSWMDNNVNSGITHSYRVEARVTVNGSARTASASITLKWDKGLSISSPSVSSTQGDKATVKWTAASGAGGYLVYRQSGSSYQLVMDTTSTSPQFTGLDPGVTYQYVVVPYRKSGTETVYGNVSSAISVRTKLAAVTLKAASASYSSIKLTWNERAGASGYNIYRRTASTSYKLIKRISTGSTTSYTNTKLTLGTKYYYKIVPFKTTSAGDYEGVASNIASTKPALPKATLSTVKGTDYKTIKVTWKKITGAQGYELYRSTSSGSGYKLVKRISGSKTSYSDSGLSIGRTYYYKIRAYRTVNGKKVYGSYSKILKGQTVLDQVKSLKVTEENYSTLKLTWKKASRADKYQIYYATSKDGTYKKLATTEDTEYKWTKATCGQTYYFKVRSMKTENGRTGYGTYSSIVSKKTTIGKPSPKIEKITYNSVTLEWEKVDGAQKYEIYGSTSKTGTYTSLGTTTSTSFTHKNLVLEKTYYYKVRAIRQKYTSGFSGVKSAKTTLGKLTGLKVTKNSDGDLKVSWDEVDGATSYQVYRSTDKNDDEEYKRIATVTATSFVDTSASSSKTYYYKVCGVRGESKTELAGPVSLGSSVGTKVVAKGIDVSSYQGTIDWKKVANDGIDFVMIRTVTGSSSSTDRDERFVDNYDGARNNGIKVGAYRYSYATSRTKAREEAENVIKALNGRKLDYPIVMDMEDSSILNGTDSNARRSEIILAFKEVVEDAGYKFALYANTTWLNSYLDMDALKDVDIWVARWRDLNSGHGYTGKGNVVMWQYSSSGTVNGISGKVDLNVSYKEY